MKENKDDEVQVMIGQFRISVGRGKRWGEYFMIGQQAQNTLLLPIVHWTRPWKEGGNRENEKKEKLTLSKERKKKRRGREGGGECDNKKNQSQSHALRSINFFATETSVKKKEINSRK